MTGQTDGSHGAIRDGLVVVHVTDAINPTLAGRGEVSYHSPPQPRAEAIDLVRLLLGRSEAPTAAEQRWTCPIAGGRRTVTLEPVPAPPAR
jgi:hypothetical protein